MADEKKIEAWATYYSDGKRDSVYSGSQSMACARERAARFAGMTYKPLIVDPDWTPPYQPPQGVELPDWLDWKGEYRAPKKWEPYLASDGSVVIAQGDHPQCHRRHILRAKQPACDASTPTTEPTIDRETVLCVLEMLGKAAESVDPDSIIYVDVEGSCQMRDMDDTLLHILGDASEAAAWIIANQPEKACPGDEQCPQCGSVGYAIDEHLSPVNGRCAKCQPKEACSSTPDRETVLCVLEMIANAAEKHGTELYSGRVEILDSGTVRVGSFNGSSFRNVTIDLEYEASAAAAWIVAHGGAQ